MSRHRQSPMWAKSPWCYQESTCGLSSYHHLCLLNRNTSNITQSKPPEQPQRNSSWGRVEQWVNSPPKLTFPYPGLPKTGFSIETSADQQPWWSPPATSSSKSLSQKQRPTYLQSKYSKFDIYTICWLEQLCSHFHMWIMKFTRQQNP